VSEAASTVEPGGGWERLPERLRPRTHERRGRGEQRLVESTLLVLAFLVLAVAVVNDVVRQVHVNERLTVDLRTWQTITGNMLKNISIEQDLTHHTTRDVLCGNTGAGPPGTQPQACLILTGPTVQGLRAAKGGFYLPPYFQDKHANRYACFGTAVSEKLCGLPTPPGAPDEPLTGG
jgi:hypothetical protein